MKRGTNRIAALDVATRGQIVSLRKAGMYPAAIAERLGLEKQSERNAVSAICNEPGLRIYGKSFEVGGPIKPGRNAAAVIRP